MGRPTRDNQRSVVERLDYTRGNKPYPAHFSRALWSPPKVGPLGLPRPERLYYSVEKGVAPSG